MRVREFGLLGILLFLLSACSTITNYNNKVEEESQRKISTAKINVELGIAYLERQNFPRAKRKLSQALNQAPEIPEPWYSMAYYYEAIGEKNLANKYYSKAIDIAPERGDTHNNYGTFLCRQKNYQAAVKQFLIALEDENYLDPASAYENAGLCAAKIPDKKAAARYLERAIKQDPNRPSSLYKLAEIYYHQGQFQVAQTRMQQFSSIAPHNEQTLALRSKIENRLFAQNQAHFVSNVTFKNFLQHDTRQFVKRKQLVNREALRQHYLKPAKVKIIALNANSPAHHFAKKSMQDKHHRLALKKEPPSKKSNKKNKHHVLKNKPRVLANRHHEQNRKVLSKKNDKHYGKKVTATT